MQVVSWVGLAKGSHIEAFLLSHLKVIGCTLHLKREFDLE